MFHQLYVLALVGPPTTVPRIPTAWLPRSVPEVEGVERTLSVPPNTCTRSPITNLVDGGVTVETVTVALAAGEVPPAPVHVSENVEVTVGDTLTLPEVPEAVKPEPVQEVALVELHVSVEG